MVGARCSCSSHCAAATKSSIFDEKSVSSKAPPLSPSPVKSKRSTPKSCAVGLRATAAAALLCVEQVKQYAKSIHALGSTLSSGLCTSPASSAWVWPRERTSRMAMGGSFEGEGRAGERKSNTCRIKAHVATPSWGTACAVRNEDGMGALAVGKLRATVVRRQREREFILCRARLR